MGLDRQSHAEKNKVKERKKMRNANKELNMEELEQVSAGFHRFLLPIVTTSHLPPAMDGAFFCRVIRAEVLILRGWRA